MTTVDHFTPLALCVRGNENICSHAVTILGNMIHKEVKTIASKKVESTLLFKSKNCITNFKWATVHGEMVSHTPLLCKILTAATKTRAEQQNQAAVIGICFAVIMKQRNPTLNLLQKIISLILYSGHSSKLVSLLLRIKISAPWLLYRYISDCSH